MGQDIYQIWQHNVSGECYAVLVVGGIVMGASGPLHHSDLDAALAGNWDNDEEVRHDLANHPDDYTLYSSE
jgi:hypothetical protein